MAKQAKQSRKIRMRRKSKRKTRRRRISKPVGVLQKKEQKTGIRYR